MLNWCSCSSATQRKGRSGRTCDGDVFRLVPHNVFLGFAAYDTPSMQHSSLRQETLRLASSPDRSLSNVVSLYDKCLDAPAPEVVAEALQHLVDINMTLCS